MNTQDKIEFYNEAMNVIRTDKDLQDLIAQGMSERQLFWVYVDFEIDRGVLSPNARVVFDFDELKFLAGE